MGNCTYVGVVSVAGEFKDGGWFITSKNLPGFFLAGNDLVKLVSDIPTNIQMLYRLNYGMNVSVSPAGEPGVTKAKGAVPPYWAAVPGKQDNNKAA